MMWRIFKFLAFASAIVCILALVMLVASFWLPYEMTFKNGDHVRIGNGHIVERAAGSDAGIVDPLIGYVIIFAMLPAAWLAVNFCVGRRPRRGFPVEIDAKAGQPQK
jgi:hypothetical protein